MFLRFNFAQCRCDAERLIAQITRQLGWASSKVKAKLGRDKWALNRELKEEQEWLDWINDNDK